jgi:hypothetical protein
MTEVVCMTDALQDAPNLMHVITIRWLQLKISRVCMAASLVV